MATTQSFANSALTAESAEDHMEMSASPYMQMDDIDFDLDDIREPSIADNSMIDENTETLPAGSYDDTMRDGANENEVLDAEDEFIIDPEEALFNEEANAISYGAMTEDPILEHSNGKFSTTRIEDVVSEESGRVDEPEAPVEEELLSEEEDTNNQDIHYNTAPIGTDATIIYTHEAHETKTNPLDATAMVNSEKDHSATENVHVVGGNGNDAKIDPNHTDEDVNQKSNVTESVPVESSYEVVPYEGQENEEDALSDHSPDVEPVERDEEQENASRQNSAPTMLHPVILRYQGQDMSLFPPLEEDDSTTYFLEDPSLAFETLDKLLAACHNLLGESLGHDDEIVLEIPSLGLHICEESKYAVQLTLAQVIDTYMLLSQNEQLSLIKPLYCELSHRVCLASQLAYLVQSAREGKTYSAIVAEHADSPELENQAEVEYGDTTTYHDAADALDDNDVADEVAAAIEAQESNSEPPVDEEVGISGVSEMFTGETLFDADEFESADQAPDVPDNDPAETSAIPSVDEDVVESHVSLEDDAVSRSSHTLDDDHTADIHIDPSAPQELEHDLLSDDGDHLALDDDLTEEGGADTEPATTTATNGNHVHHEEISDDHMNQSTVEDEFNLDEFLDANDDDATVEAPPAAILATPSKTSMGKRKTMDDNDDFLELDLSTPEPKRTRAS